MIKKKALPEEVLESLRKQLSEEKYEKWIEKPIYRMEVRNLEKKHVIDVLHKILSSYPYRDLEIKISPAKKGYVVRYRLVEWDEENEEWIPSAEISRKLFGGGNSYIRTVIDGREISRTP